MGGTLIVGTNPAAGHNYQRRLLEMIAAGAFADLPKGEVFRLAVIHEDGCGIFNGGVCDCEPTFELQPVGGGRRRLEQGGGEVRPMAAWRYRKCPHCGTVRPGGDFRPVRYGAHWTAGGSDWRRCPSCGHKGPTRDFAVVADKRAGR